MNNIIIIIMITRRQKKKDTTRSDPYTHPYPIHNNTYAAPSHYY